MRHLKPIQKALAVAIACLAVVASGAYAQPRTWSENDAALKAPPAPQLIAPLKGNISAGTTRFEWREIEGFQWYRWTLFRDGKAVQAANVQGTAHEAVGLKPGKYIWTVQAMKRVPPGTRAPASAVNGWINGTRAAAGPVIVPGEVSKNAPLAPIRPKGTILYSREPMVFAWQGSASQYSVTLYRYLDSGKAVKVATVNNVKSNSAVDIVPNFPPGRYGWQVSGEDETGGKSQSKLTEFMVVNALENRSGHGTLSAGYTGSSFLHDGVSPEFETSFEGTSSGVFAEGEYYLTDGLVLGASFLQTKMTFQSESSNFQAIQGSLQYRGRFGKSRLGYGFGLDVSRSTLPEILGSLDPDTEQKTYTRHALTRLSVAPRLLLSLRFDARTSLALHVSRPMTLTLAASDGAISKADPGMLYRVGATMQGAWFYPWGVRLDAYLFKDGTSYTTSDGKYDLIYSGFQFGAGVFYNF